MFLKGLIAVACLVVIAAGGVWLWQQFQAGTNPPAMTRETCLAALEPWVKSKATEMNVYLIHCRDAGLINLSDVPQFMD